MSDVVLASVTLTVTFMLEVTERRQAEAALGRSEARFRQLIEAAPEPIAVIRMGRFAYVNPALVRVLGYPKIVAWMLRSGMTPEAVLAQVDALLQQVPEPDLGSPQATSAVSPLASAPARCQDPDDQKFIDLAWTRRSRQQA